MYSLLLLNVISEHPALRSSFVCVFGPLGKLSVRWFLGTGTGEGGAGGSFWFVWFVKRHRVWYSCITLFSICRLLLFWKWTNAGFIIVLWQKYYLRYKKSNLDFTDSLGKCLYTSIIFGRDFVRVKKERRKTLFLKELEQILLGWKRMQMHTSKVLWKIGEKKYRYT